MKILLFITSIYNTLGNENDDSYKNLIDNLEKIREISNNDIIIISFCDNTENRNIMLFYARKLLKHIKDKNIIFGNQLLGNVYYNNLEDGAIMYNNANMDKIDKINDYIKRINDNNDIEIIIVDGNMNIEEYKERIKYQCSFIYNISNINEINDTLSELCDIKRKRLQF